MEHFLILGLIAVALVLLALEVARPDIVALGVMLVLLLSGVVTIEEGFSGFSNPAVITVIAMFILSGGLVRTGIADYVAERIVNFGGNNQIVLTITVMLTVGVMSAFMNNIGAVAVLLPAMFVIAQKSNYAVTRLLMPLSFGSLMGGLTTLIGTPPNLLVSIALESAGYPGFRMFDFAPTGLAIMLVGAFYMALIGRHLIPVRKTEGDLTREYKLEEYLTEVVIPEKSVFIGKTIVESGLRSEHGLIVLRIHRPLNGQLITLEPGPHTVLKAEDRLIVEGSVLGLVRDREGGPLKIYADRKFTEDSLADEELELAEVAISPNSKLVGQRIDQGHIRHRFNILVLAFRRRGQTLHDRFISIPLEVGDVLLVQGSQAAIRELAQSADFLVVNRLDHASRDVKRAPIAVGIMVISITAAATGLLHISVAGMLGVLLMVLTKCIRVQDMYYEVEWRVIFLIAGMMPLGIAMDDRHTATARWLADQILAVAGSYGPTVLLAAILVFTTLLTQVMSNAAAVVLLAPIGIAMATGMGIQPYPFLMGIAIAASTAFLTPIGHQSNVLVYGVGNYRFSDFPRVGGPLSVVILLMALFLVPAIWPFQPLR